MTSELSARLLAFRQYLEMRRLCIGPKATGKPFEILKRDTDRCLYMDAEAALAYGVVDKIVKKTETESDLLRANVAEISRGLG